MPAGQVQPAAQVIVAGRLQLFCRQCGNQFPDGVVVGGRVVAFQQRAGEYALAGCGQALAIAGLLQKAVTSPDMLKAIAALYATGVRPGDRYMCPSSPAWGHGLWHGTLAPLALGVTTGTFAYNNCDYRVLEALLDQAPDP